MAASMVNIADFRCRDLKVRVGHSSSFENRTGFEIVEPDLTAEREAEPLEEGVLDISVARDSARMRQRMAFRPLTTSRHRSNLVRFNEPHVTVMKINAVRASEPSDDCDFPPAA